MCKPRKTQSDGSGVSQDKPHNLSICCLASTSKLTASALPCCVSPRLAESPYCLGLGKNMSTTSLDFSISTQQN